jgi:polar amino acid transport system substrate-binding protein
MLPVIVMLMIFYYIVFSNAPVNGVFVSIVVFSLTFGASVFGMLTSSINTIDRGQTEAAYALGFSNLRTFFKIVLPQALKFFLPSYKSELVALIKATAVVGYIAVQDLTRVGDIVRSRTYEAFFPIISVAVIYFIMAWILIVLVDRIEIKIDPKRRKRDDILKGVKTND